MEVKDGHLAFPLKKNAEGKLIENEYDCEHCLRNHAPHSVRSVPHGVTGKDSCWPAGLPTTRRECDTCGRWDGPWISASIVGGGW